VFDDWTDGLHLEHVDCQDCGNNDVHGQFQAIGTRRLMGPFINSNSNNNIGNDDGRKNTTKFVDLRLHFFEVTPRPFSILEFFNNVFSTESAARVKAVLQPVVDEHSHGHSHGHAQDKAHGHEHGHAHEEAHAGHGHGHGHGHEHGHSKCGGGHDHSHKHQSNNHDHSHAHDKEEHPTTCNHHHGEKQQGHHHDHGHSHDHHHDHGHDHKHGESCGNHGTCAASSLPIELVHPEENSTGKTVRSTIVCTGICCSSEIPMIHNIVKPLHGIAKTMINVPLKQVVLDHNPKVISATDIEDALNKAAFGATIKKDGGAGGATSSSSTGRSQFHVNKICCSSEIPAINSILEPIQGVSNVSINVTTKMVCV
jgi:copper chaperone CopZ